MFFLTLMEDNSFKLHDYDHSFSEFIINEVKRFSAIFWYRDGGYCDAWMEVKEYEHHEEHFKVNQVVIKKNRIYGFLRNPMDTLILAERDLKRWLLKEDSPAWWTRANIDYVKNMKAKNNESDIIDYFLSVEKINTTFLTGKSTGGTKYWENECCIIQYS